MRDCSVFVGLDYHQDSIQVCVLNRSGTLLANRACPNHWAAVRSLAQAHGRVQEAALESCTGAAHLAEELVQRAGWSVHLAHPGYVSRMKQNPDKTDYSDAHMLADLVRVGYLPRVWLAPAGLRELRRLIRYRQQWVNERRNTKLRIRALLREERIRSPGVKAWSRLWLEWLGQQEAFRAQTRWIIDRHLAHLQTCRQEILLVETRLMQLTRDDVMVLRLRALPGIGPVTAWMLRAEIGRFDRFRSGKQLARFCGLSPRNCSSGQRQADAGLIKAGNRYLRSVAVEAAHRLIRYEPRWAALAARMRRGGKPGSLIAAAVANRWLRWLFHQMQPAPRAA